MGPVEKLLTESWELIKDPNNRTINCLARDFWDVPTNPNSKYACKWCAVGALYKVSGYMYSEYINQKTSLEFNLALLFLNKASGNLCKEKTLGQFNDFDVINNPPLIYKEAIKLAQED